VILVSIDTLRADHVGAYGYPKPTTPRIDEFARDAVIFRTCVAPATSTLASHGSIFTSLLPIHHGASTGFRTGIPTRLSATSKPLAEVLKRNGYHTASFNGGVQLDAAYGVDRGFDVYVSAREMKADAALLTGPETRTIAAVNDSLRWIDREERPFFLFVHSYEIHHPYTPDAESLRSFETSYSGSLPNAISAKQLMDMQRGTQPLSPADLAHIVNLYDAELRSADAAFGALIDGLKQRDLYDGSLIVFTSDHGEEFGEHGVTGWHSHALYDEQLLVPLIVKFPAGWRAGEVVDLQVRSIDIAPTLLATLGVEAPPSYRGTDLRPFLSGDEGRDLPAVSQLDWGPKNESWSVRSQGFKLYRGKQALYDLTEDAGETRNVASEHPEQTTLLRRLGVELLRERPIPEPEPANPSDQNLEALRTLGYIE